jgi:hypothetical protein
MISVCEEKLFALQVRESVLLHMPDSLPAWAAFLERQEDRAGPSLVKRTSLHYRCAACFYLVSRIRLISVYYKLASLRCNDQPVHLALHCSRIMHANTISETVLLLNLCDHRRSDRI